MTYQCAEPIVGRFSVSPGGEFGADRSSYGPPTPPEHTGVDHATPIGTPLPAMLAGVVTYAGWADARSGIVVRVTDPATGESVLHAHLADVAVVSGDRVAADQLVGRTGNTGSASTGPHLHTEHCVEHRHPAGITCYQAGTLRDPLKTLRRKDMLTREEIVALIDARVLELLEEDQRVKDKVGGIVAQQITEALAKP